MKLQLKGIVKRKANRDKKNHFKTIVNDYTRNVTRQTYDTGISIKQSKAENRLLSLLMVYPDCVKLLDDFDSSRLSSGFVKKAYDVILEKIRDGSDLDLMTFGDVFTEDEYSKLSRIINDDTESNDSKKEFSDCIKIINQEYENKNSSSPSDMSDDEFRNLFSKIDK